MTKAIWFDMDGTIADLYSVDGWLAYLQAQDTTPYEQAKVMHNMAQLARLLNSAQRKGYTIGVISWTAKHGTDSYNKAVAQAKLAWLNKHLHSVRWNTIKVVEYGTNKYNACGGGILFDDEEGNRNAWKDTAYTPDRIMEVLRNL